MYGESMNPYYPLEVARNKYQLDTTLTTVGSAGSAAASGKLGRIKNGWIDSIKLNIDGSIPNTTDITVYVVTGGEVVNLLTLTNIADAAAAEAPLYRPRLPVHDTNGVELTYDGTEPIVDPLWVSEGDVYASVAQCNALTNVLKVVVNWTREKPSK